MERKYESFKEDFDQGKSSMESIGVNAIFLMNILVQHFQIFSQFFLFWLSILHNIDIIVPLADIMEVLNVTRLVLNDLL